MEVRPVDNGRLPENGSRCDFLCGLYRGLPGSCCFLRWDVPVDNLFWPEGPDGNCTLLALAIISACGEFKDPTVALTVTLANCGYFVTNEFTTDSSCASTG